MRRRARFGGFSIRRQLIIGVAIVHLLLMSIFVLDLTSRERSFLTESAKSRAIFQVNVLAKGSLPHVILDDIAGLSEVVDAFTREPSVRYAMITGIDGRVLSHTDRGRQGQYVSDAKSLQVLKGPLEPRLLYESDRTVQATAPILAGARPIGWAWLGMDRSADQQNLARVTRSGLLYTAAAVMIGAIFAIVLATTITRPLRLLLLGAKRLSQDRLDIPVPVRGTNEVATVAQAFNAAMQRLKEQRTELQTAHDDLEQRVEERTRELAAEIRERTEAQEALRKAHAELEDRVRERTAELAQSNALLARSNQDLEQFAYAASHDLQEPLRTIKNFTTLLARRYRGKMDADADEFVGYIVDGAERMETLIRDLLGYSRAGRSDKRLDRVDCGQALNTALSNLRGAIESSGAKVTSGPLPEVLANDVELVQLFQNLVGNAIKYRSKRPPEIHVSASTSSGEWILEVRDNGIGIQPQYQVRIFGVFQRLHGKEMPGSGIGLATCSRIVERLGGRIWVDSEFGAGSTFKFAIPERAVKSPAPADFQLALVEKKS